MTRVQEHFSQIASAYRAARITDLVTATSSLRPRWTDLPQLGSQWLRRPGIRHVAGRELHVRD